MSRFVPGPVNRGVPWPLQITAFAIGVLALWVGSRRLDRIMYPWAFAHPGRPAMRGTWVGRLTTGGGRPRVVPLNVERYVSTGRRHRRDASLAGSGLTCDER